MSACADVDNPVMLLLLVVFAMGCVLGMLLEKYVRED